MKTEDPKEHYFDHLQSGTCRAYSREILFRVALRLSRKDQASFSEFFKHCLNSKNCTVKEIRLFIESK